MSGCSAVGCSNRGDKGYFMKSFPRDPQRRALWAARMNREGWQPSNNSRLCEVHFDNDQWERTRQDGTRKLKCNAVPTLFDYTKKTTKRKTGKSNTPPSEFPDRADVSSPDERSRYLNKARLKVQRERTLIGSFDEGGETFPMSSEIIKVPERRVKLSPEEESLETVAEKQLDGITRQSSDFEKRLSLSCGRSRNRNSELVKAITDLEKKKWLCSAVNCGNQFGNCDSEISFHKFPLNNSILLKEWLRICKPDWAPTKWSLLCSNHFTRDCFRTDDKKKLTNAAVPILSNGYPDDEEIMGYQSDSIQNVIYGDNELEFDDEIDEMRMEQSEQTCRLCAASGVNYTPIFGESNLAEKISRCLPLIVLPSDELPHFLCEKCKYHLNISYKLIVSCVRTDAFLRSQLAKSKELPNNEWSVDSLFSNVKDEKATDKEESENSIEERNDGGDEPVFSIEGPIKCDLCEEVFHDMIIFDTHIENAHLLQWRCSLCDHSFQTSQELITHKNLNHSGQILTCRNCLDLHEMTTDSDVLQFDPKAIVLNGVAQAGLPMSNGETILDIVTEEMQPTEDTLDLTCTKCNVIFDNAKQFRKHHTIHLPRVVRCVLCLQRCASVYDYFVHKRKVHGLGRKNKQAGNRSTAVIHTCKYCSRTFRMNQQLLIHLRKHKKEMLEDPTVTVYKCVTCPKKFVDKSLYQKHRNVHDPACWHKFRCYVCNRSFMDRFKLRTHQFIHDGIKPYQCDICGRMFNRNANMTRHRSKHFEQACSHCQKVFTDTRTLTEHLRDVHQEIKPRVQKYTKRKGQTGVGNQNENTTSDNFVCRFCGKQLTSYYSLLGHERIHTGDKPYECRICGKAFRSITARWDHMVRHEKGSYMCELCGKTVSNKINLGRHLRKHAAIEQRRFECKECGKLFHLKWRLDAHLLRIHHSGPSS